MKFATGVSDSLFGRSDALIDRCNKFTEISAHLSHLEVLLNNDATFSRGNYVKDLVMDRNTTEVVEREKEKIEALRGLFHDHMETFEHIVTNVTTLFDNASSIHDKLFGSHISDDSTHSPQEFIFVRLLLVTLAFWILVGRESRSFF